MRALGPFLLLLGCQTEIAFPLGGGHFPSPLVPSFVHQARFAITNNRSDSLSFVTASTSPITKLGDVPIGDNPVELEGPHHIAASPDGKFLVYNLSNYVPGTGSGPHGSHGLGNLPGSLVKLDAATMQNLGEALVDRSPGEVILSQDGRFAYVTHYDLLRELQALTQGGKEEMAYSALAIVETATMVRRSLTPVCVTAHGAGLAADGKTIYLTCAHTDQLAVVDVADPAHPAVVSRLPVGPNPSPFGSPPTYGPYALSISPGDGSVWISDNNSGDVRVYDPQTGAMDAKRTLFVGGIAMFSAFSQDGKTLFVPHQGDDKITLIDTSTLSKKELSLPAQACLNVHLITLTPDQKGALVVCEGMPPKRLGSALSLSLDPLAVTGFVELQQFPDGAAWLPPWP